MFIKYFEFEMVLYFVLKYYIIIENNILKIYFNFWLMEVFEWVMGILVILIIISLVISDDMKYLV